MDQPALLASRPDPVAAAAEAYGTLARALQDRRSEWIRDTLDPLDAAWQGRAAELARRTVGGLAAKLQAAQLELTAVQQTLEEAAEVFALARSACDEAAADFAPDRASVGFDPLGLAEDADRTTAERLQRMAEAACSGQALSPRAGMGELMRLTAPSCSLLAAALPAPGTPPDRIAAWWRGLGQDGRERLTKDHPELVGNLDGLPARDRDRANRLALDHLLAHPERLAEPQLSGLRAIRERLAAGPADLLLLGLGTEGQGRGILSYGDPDTADDVAVYVPGFGTELAGVGGGDAERARRVRDGAARCGGGRTTAAMVWLGYDAPPNRGLDPRSAQVADDSRARAGADSYGRFLSGLRAARQGPPAHVTALGHSYGSLVVGLAARRPAGFAADEVVLVGSPGTEAARAADLAVGADHVYVGAADCDPVTRLPARSGAAGGWLLGGAAGAAASAAGPHELWFGQDPATRTFGAHRFAVAPGDPVNAFASHSAYFDDGPDGPSESLANISRIVADHPEDVTEDRGR